MWRSKVKEHRPGCGLIYWHVNNSLMLYQQIELCAIVFEKQFMNKITEPQPLIISDDTLLTHPPYSIFPASIGLGKLVLFVCNAMEVFIANYSPE